MSVSMLIELPDDVYRALLPKADRLGTQVHMLVSAAVTDSVRGPRSRVQRPKAKPEPREPKNDVERRIAELNGQGVSDKKIAVDVERAYSYVNHIRSEVLGLPAVGKPGRPRKAEAA